MKRNTYNWWYGLSATESINFKNKYLPEAAMLSLSEAQIEIIYDKFRADKPTPNKGESEQEQTVVGNWYVDGHNTVAVIEEMDNGGWKHICTCDFGYSDPEKFLPLNQSNARLIAQAPAMYRFIKEMAERYSNSEWIASEAKAIIQRINSNQ